MKEQDNPTLFEIMKKNPEMSYNEANKVLEELKLKKEAGACITSGMKRDRDATDKMKKDREVKLVPLTESRQKQEELEPIEYDYHKYWKDMYEKAQARIKELEKNRSLDTMDEIAYNEATDRVKELDNSLAIALEINEKHQRYNGKLQTRVTELEEDNIKLAHQVEDLKLNHVRKAGL